MAEYTYPGDANTFRTQWPVVVGSGDGITFDRVGDSYGLAASGSAPEVTVSPSSSGSSSAKVAGFSHVLDAPKVLDVSAVGTLPATGQKRVDYVVLRYDWSADLDEALTLEILPGSPVTTATADATAAPSLTRTFGNVYEVPLWRYRLPADGTPEALLDLRPYSGEEILVPDGVSISGLNLPLGWRARKGQTLWRWEKSGSSVVPVRSEAGQLRWKQPTSFDSTIGGTPPEDAELIFSGGVTNVTFGSTGIGSINVGSNTFPNGIVSFAVHQAYDSAFASSSTGPLPSPLWPLIGGGSSGTNRTTLRFMRKRVDKSDYPGSGVVVWSAVGW